MKKNTSKFKKSGFQALLFKILLAIGVQFVCFNDLLIFTIHECLEIFINYYSPPCYCAKKILNDKGYSRK